MRRGLRRAGGASPRDLLAARLRKTGLYAILDTGAVEARELPRLAGLLARAGVRVFQLRAKGLPDRAFLDLALRMRKILGRCSLIINDRADIAASFRADGVHLGQDDIPVPVARRILGNRAAIGLSAGDPAEIRRAVAGAPDYISLGPAFSTRTKANAGPPLGEGGLRRLGRLVPGRLLKLAVGGITPHNVMVTVKCGIDAVAVASGILRCADPENTAERMMAAIRWARTGILSESKPGGGRW